VPAARRTHGRRCGTGSVCTCGKASSGVHLECPVSSPQVPLECTVVPFRTPLTAPLHRRAVSAVSARRCNVNVPRGGARAPNGATAPVRALLRGPRPCGTRTVLKECSQGARGKVAGYSGNLAGYFPSAHTSTRQCGRTAPLSGRPGESACTGHTLGAQQNHQLPHAPSRVQRATSAYNLHCGARNIAA
jgi:hypothetical protein